MPDISRLAIEINSEGFLSAKANAEAYVKAQEEAAKESTKYEQELQRLNDILKRISDTGRYFNSSLDTIVQAQQEVQASMFKLIQSGDASSDSLIKLAYQYNELGQEIKKLSSMQSIMESYDSDMKLLDTDTSLFGESLENLQRQQNLAKTAMIQLVSSGISPTSIEVTNLRNKYQALGETIDKTCKNIKGFSSDFTGFQLIANKLPGTLKSISSGMMGLVSPQLAAVGAVIELTEAAINFGKASIQAFSDFEMIETNLEMVMGSAEQAAIMFGELKTMAARTPFSVEGLAQAAVQLRQTGTAAKDLIPVLTMLGDSASGNTDRFNRIVQNYAQISSTMKATAMDIRQFAAAGLPIYDTLRDMGVQGDVTAEAIQEAFRSMTAEGSMFFEGMQRGSETMQGTFSNLSDNFRTFLAEFAEWSGLAEVVRWYAEGLSGVAGAAADAMAAENTLREATEAWNQATATQSQRLLYTESQIASLNEEYTRLLELMNRYRGNEYLVPAEIKNRFTELHTELERLESLRDAAGSAGEASARRSALLDEIKAEGDAFDNLMSEMEAKYQQTSQSQHEAILKQIADLEKLKTATRRVAEEQPNGTLKITEQGASATQLTMIHTVIAALTESLDKLTKSTKESRTELADWKKILQQITGFSQKQMEQMWTGMKDGQSLPVIQQFEAVIKLRREAAQSFAGLTGGDPIDAYQGEYDTWAAMVQGMMTVHEETLKDGSQVWKRVWEENEEAFKTAVDHMKAAKKTMDEALDTEQFEKRLADLDKAYSILTASDDRTKYGLENNLSGDKLDEAYRKDQRNTTWEKINRGTGYVDNLQQQLALEKQLVMGEIDRNEYAAQVLSTQQNIELSAARQAVEVQNQIDNWKLLGAMLTQLRDISLSSLVDMAHELGEAFRDGTLSSKEFGDALGNMIKRIVDALPQLLLSAGLQVMATGNWQVGLALIAASGLASFVSGMISDGQKDGTEDQVAKLQRIQDEISKLIDQQKSLEEYYVKKRQELNAQAAMGATSVNDMIITPQGRFSTHPDDYIIATKHPESIGTGGNVVTMHVKIINNAGSAVTTEQRMGDDGIGELLVMIDKQIQNNVASGKWDRTLAIRESRNQGRSIKTS